MCKELPTLVFDKSQSNPLTSISTFKFNQESAESLDLSLFSHWLNAKFFGF